MSDKLIDTKKLCEQIDMPLQSVWRLVRENKLPHYRVGKLIKFNLKEVLDALRVDGTDSHGKVDE